MNVPTGYTALDMIGFTDKGVYNSATAYVKNDIVHYNGNLWKCLVDDTTAVTPAEGASWTVFLAEPTSAAEDIIATVEPSVVSTHQYTAGKQLILNDILYTVTAAVNIGDTLAVGTNIVASDTIVEQLTTKANTSSLATVATSGSYADLSNKPTLGTAAAKDVPASGNASTTEVVMGDDTRLSNDRNAADVYPWAKAANKPIYNGSEINTSAAQTGTAQSAVAATIASGTSMDAAIGDLLDNDVTINTDIGNVKQALTDEAATRSALGAKNLLDTELGARGEVNGITYTRGDDGVITANGTATGDAWNLLCDYKLLKAGRYILSGCPAGGSSNTYFMYTEGGITNYDYGNGKTFTLASDTPIRFGICIKGGQSPSDLKFYPMIRLATDTDTTYQPYAMTNQQLTENKADKSDLASISITGTTNTTGATITSGTYFYLNGLLVKAKTGIANGATLTSGTNYENVTTGSLNQLQSLLNSIFGVTGSSPSPLSCTSMKFSGTDDYFMQVKETGDEDYKGIQIKDKNDNIRYSLTFKNGHLFFYSKDASGNMIVNETQII